MNRINATAERSVVDSSVTDKLEPVGVSVVVCCHNSATRLPQTLAHLAAQRVSDDVLAEVIVIDNASGDNTAAVAEKSWPKDCPIPLRVISEAQLGLSFARVRGLMESKYDLVCLVDDDNWVCRDWIQIVAETMNQHPEVGACGGFIESVCQASPPWWFEKFKSSFAPEAQGPPEGGDVTWRRFLMGAGLTIRKTAWLKIMDSGFNFLLVDRQGTQLTAGGDHELCHAICLAGWRLWYEPRLQLEHYIPAGRLNWSVLRRQARGAGRCEAGLDPYRFVFQEQEQNHTGRSPTLNGLLESWYWQILVSIRYLARHPLKLIKSFFRTLEGDPVVIWIERWIGRLAGLLEKRDTYKMNLQRIRGASWRNSRSH